MPRQLADMDQPIRAAEVDKRAEIAQPGDRPGDDISLRKLAEQARLLLRAPFALRLALGEDQPAAVLIDLDHLDVQFLTDEVIQRFAALVPLKPGAYRDHVRRGDEAFEQSPADEDPAAIVSGDGDLDHFLAFNQLAGAVPVVLLKPHVDRHDELPLAAAGVEDVDRDFLPDAQRGAIFRIEPFEILSGDDAVLLGAHVDDDLVRLDLHDRRVANLTSARWGIVERSFEHLCEALAFRLPLLGLFVFWLVIVLPFHLVVIRLVLWVLLGTVASTVSSRAARPTYADARAWLGAAMDFL